MLGELESDDLDLTRSGRTSAASRLARIEVSASAAVATLVVLAVVSVALRIVLARAIHGPFVFMDELGYAQMAHSFARTGNLALYGKTGLAYSPLYSIVLSPVYALASSAQSAYAWAKVVNALLMSLSAFPVYAIARSVLTRPRAVGAAALSLAAPLMFYSGLEMSESLAYPLFLVAVWAMLRAVREPSVRNDALLLGAILLACTARLQQIALVPAALTAVVLVALVRPTDGRLRTVWQAISGHRLLFGTTTVGLVAVLARTIANGGALPLAGRYSNVGGARANPLRVLDIAVEHVAAFDFALGVVPFAGALLGAYALVRFGFPRRALVFGSVAAATTAWLLLEVAFDAAAFDSSSAPRRATQLAASLPRIHQRYLIYLVPLFLVALVAALRATRPRVSWWVIVAAGAVAAALPTLIPFDTDINTSSVADTFGLQIFAQVVDGAIAPIAHATLVALVVASVLAVTFLYALLRPRPSFAIVITLFAFFFFSSLVRVRLIGTAAGFTAPQPVQRNWVDRAVDGDVVLVGGPGATRLALLDTAAGNLSISRVYYLCDKAFGSDFGERQVSIDQSGRIGAAGGPIRARYAVVPARLPVRGRVLARNPKGHLVLVAPAGGVVSVPPAGRAAASCTS